MTHWIILSSGVGLLLVYEIAAAITKRFPTISQLVWHYNVHPFVPFAFGVLMGHFFA